MPLKLNVSFGKEELAKYPFTKDALNYVKELGFSLEELTSSYGKNILERAVDRIIHSITGTYDSRLAKDLDVEVLSFPTAVLLVGSIQDKYLARAFSVGEGKRAFMFLRAEELGKVIYVAMNTFSWDIRMVEVLGRCYPSIKFTDYVSNVPTYRGKWKLVNRILIGGYVPLTREELARIIEEGVKRKVMELVEEVKVKVPELPEGVKPFLDEVKKTWAPRRERIMEVLHGTEGGSEESYPPCMRALLEDAREGKNLSHIARFALTTFLLNIGWKVEGIVRLFSSLPDFNESVTRYQVEHLAGLRGSRTKYTTLKCSNMRTYGLCPMKEGCIGVNHPLQYYVRRMREQRREKGKVPNKPV